MKISQYDIDGPQNLKIAFLADLHEKDPREVLLTLEGMKPDVILVCGDILERHIKGNDPKLAQYLSLHNGFKKLKKQITHSMHLLVRKFLCKNEEHHENAYEFLKGARKLAPVFLSRGNHEWYYEMEDLKFFYETGVKLLDNSFTDYKGIKLGGLSPRFDEDFLDQFEALEGYKILLCHHPEYYKPLLKGRKINLVLSGHAHGGQIKIAGRGLFSPGQGLFPKLTCGKYFGNLIVTAGCANTVKIPRFGNPCEVVEINMQRVDTATF